MKFVLFALSILGTLITASSSYWSLTNRLYVEDESGKRSLLPQGRIALAITAVGVLVTILSGILGFKVSQDDAYAKARLENDQQMKRERERLEDMQRQIALAQQIILSGQPLRSFELTWDFFEVDGDIERFLDEKRKAVEEDPERNADLYQATTPRIHEENLELLRRHWQLYPFLNAVASNEISDDPKPVIALFSLEGQNNSILSFGLVDLPLVGQPGGGPTKPEPSKLSGSIEFAEDEEAFRHMASRPERSRSAEAPQLEQHGENGYRLTWQLGPASFLNAMDQASPVDVLNSVLPEKFRIMLLSDVEQLPFDGFNTTAIPKERTPEGWLPGNESMGTSTVDVPFERSSISLCYNQIAANCAEYEVVPVIRSDIVEHVDDAIRDEYASALIFSCRKKR